ncbi:MAG TPA: hypothetical protein VFE58_15825 [Tepidisphaeraceae bacterium]|jgi:hypothetical protein|nr:hypothetical protein [Tepidisphaeraceae bacterium]
MIELIDTFPNVDVQRTEYKRLLGYPRERVLDGRARELADLARAWYAQHGRPWVYARQVEKLDITNGSILIDSVPFSSPRLLKTLKDANADSAILVAVSAGPEIEAEAQKLWKEEKPDEYFFLEIFGSAVVEHLTTMTGARLCSWAESHNMAVLPHYSPGYPEWDISQQSSLLQLISKSNKLPGPLAVLESGMLRPKKSLLAVFGLTHQTDRVRLTDLTPCDNCSFSPCQYRRTPYKRSLEVLKPETLPSTGSTDEIEVPTLNTSAKYSVNPKALSRWITERLTLTPLPDGSTHALFKYEGSTCTNSGRTIRFHYEVTVGPRADGYPLRDQKCYPAPGDTGHTHMCRYMSNPEHLMVAIAQEKPLLGQPLNDVLAWTRTPSAASCYCEPNSRKHKWGLVLETLHYALVQLENTTPKPTDSLRGSSLPVVPIT